VRAKWSTCGALIAALVVVNLLARLGTRGMNGSDDVVQFRTALISLVLMLVLIAVAGFFWARQDRSGIVIGFLAATIVATSLIVTIVGPYVSDSTPFGAGFMSWLIQWLVCAGVLLLGATIGGLLAVAFGLDPKTKAWRAYAQRTVTPRVQRTVTPQKGRKTQSKASGRK
jgi:hypothetical protein